VFRKLCRTARSSRVHKTESVSVMGRTWLAAVSSIGLVQRQRSFFDLISSFFSAMVPDHHVLRNGDVSDSQMQIRL